MDEGGEERRSVLCFYARCGGFEKAEKKDEEELRKTESEERRPPGRQIRGAGGFPGPHSRSTESRICSYQQSSE
uniref:Uncharacterized protein n=1 Tax=Arundo donax TaxID=35708 RepID=A0A0A9G706_ARUDO